MFKTVLKSEDGKLYINDVKRFVRPFFLTPDAPNQTLALAAAANSQAYAPMTVTQEGPFQGYSLVMQSDRFGLVGDHEATVLITDSGSRKQMMNRPVHANTIFGTPGFPMTLPERMFLHQNRSLTIRYQNLFANANNLRPVISGRRLYQSSAESGMFDKEIKKLTKRTLVTTPYFLTTTEDITAQTVAQGAVSYFLPTDADAYMEVFKISAVAYDATLGTLTGEFDIIIRDAETRRELETGNMSNLLICGNGLTPFILAESWLVRPKQRIEVVITNTTATGNPLTAYLTFIGRKLYV
jgi:hypothetical protein